MPNTFDARKWFLISASAAIIIIAIAVSYWFFVIGATALASGKTDNINTNSSSYGNSFTVSATQKVIINPEIMIIKAAVNSSGDDLSAMLPVHLKKMADLEQFFQGQEIAMSDVERGRVNFSPYSDCCDRYGCDYCDESESYYDEDGDRRETASSTQQISQTLTITLRDFSKFAAIAKKFKDDKVEISATNFSVTDFDQKIQEARIQAFANAKEKAEKLAIAAGVKLGEISTIRDDSHSQDYDEYDQPSEVRVSLTYKIK